MSALGKKSYHRISLQSKLVFLTAIISFSILTASSLAVAAPLYAPGETLNPSCAPTDTDCTVSPPPLYDWIQSLNTFNITALTPTSTIPLWVQSTATSTFAGGIESWAKIAAPYFIATSTTATSTFPRLASAGLATDWFCLSGSCYSSFVGLPAATTTLLSDSNTWSGSNSFGTLAASSFNLGSGLANMLAGFDASGNLTSTSSPQVAYINATSTTATSTFAGGALFATGGGNVGIGTTSPYAKLSITNTGTQPSFVVEDSASVDSTPFVIDASGQVGVGEIPSSDYLVSLNGTTATDNSSVLSITQANDAAEDSYIARGVGTQNAQTLTSVPSTRVIEGLNFTLTPTISLIPTSGFISSANANIAGSNSTLSLTNASIGESSKSAVINGYGNINQISTGASVNDSTAGGVNTVNLYGTYNKISGTTAYAGTQALNYIVYWRLF